MGAMQKLAGLMRRAIEKYDMIQPGDRIAVGVSGGKDSVALLVGLAKLKEYIGIDYEIVALPLIHVLTGWRQIIPLFPSCVRNWGFLMFSREPKSVRLCLM